MNQFASFQLARSLCCLIADPEEVIEGEKADESGCCVVEGAAALKVGGGGDGYMPVGLRWWIVRSMDGQHLSSSSSSLAACLCVSDRFCLLILSWLQSLLAR